MVSVTVLSFLLTLLFIFWRPLDMNEAVPATIGAVIVLACGSVSLQDLGKIAETISGAAITIIATIVMAIVLESFGFFTWMAQLLAEKSKGSGIRLFWNVNLLCFFMTLFFNNDGSILITTPILILLLKHFRLKNHEKIPYLLSGALIATASSAPIGVSNIVNLIALKIVHMDLYMHTAMMFVPATLGLAFLVLLLFLYFRKTLPRRLPQVTFDLSQPVSHPLKPIQDAPIKNKNAFMYKILLFVLCVRLSLFAASYVGLPVEVMAVLGSLVLLVWRWIYLKINPLDMLKKTPWHILIFAFSMYVIIYGLHNIGLTGALVGVLKPLVSEHHLYASLLMGGTLSVLSNLFNNHPALMVGTLTLTNMSLDPLTLKVAYLANVIGSDIGSLLLPIGTLATLMWMHLLKKGNVKLSWKHYFKVTIVVIPPTLVFTLICLYYWVHWLF
ncbi:arsenic transporter [Fictibacillus enclensis]|uniref:arsenic transporter n=1 Tax=Fictibacillus enclensis TaxID=1017270 RepID=UPI0024C0CD9C|nr:arsenic transporter [Fictibacillus enclensis]WHY74919.1 arsenic transporter [Fictibacillus enclensis]